MAWSIEDWQAEVHANAERRKAEREREEHPDLRLIEGSKNHERHTGRHHRANAAG